MENPQTEKDKNQKIREQVGILLVCLVLLGSGILVIRQKGTPNINFVKGGPSSTSATSVADKATSTGTNVSAATSGQTVSGATATVSSKININTASVEDLDKLPGVGPAIAQKIIDYRTQNGLFPSIEAIDNVSGIGPSKYSQMKDLISI